MAKVITPMTFTEAIPAVLTKYAEFNGKATRSEFWWWILFEALVAMALSLFTVVQVGNDASVGSILTSLWSLAIFIPTLAVTVRRLRDAGFSWGHLFWALVPFAGGIVVVVLCAQPTQAK